MAIIAFCNPTDEGATGHLLGYCHRKYETDVPYAQQLEIYGPAVYWTRLTHVGLCLTEREANGYHDSDFYMTVWDEEKQEPREICFASTRGWTYPCMGSKPDASPEVWAKYKAWGVRKQEEYRIEKRKSDAKRLCEFRNKLRKVAKENDVNYSRLLKLRKHSKFEGMLSLFGKRIRNGFRLSMRNQLITWLNSPSKYETPFSKKQMEYI